jgi:dTDP-glucose 4,6-dehydratase
LYGDGGNVRDWIHVDDHNTAVDIVLRRGEVGQVYNIGAGNEITNKELTYRLLELCGRDETYIEFVPDRLGHDRRYSIAHDKMSQLGWSTEHTLDAGLAATVEWYRANREWWEPLKAKAAL